MNIKQKISLTVLSAITLAVSYWTGYVHGSSHLSSQDMIASIALPVIFIWTIATLTFGWFFKRESVPPFNSGSQPPAAPLPGVTVPRPPGAPPVIHCGHAV